MRRTIAVIWLTLASGLLTAPAVFAAESREYGASGRISAVEGTLYGRGPYDTETSELAANAVVRQGDEVFSDEGTFAEIELPGGSFLRLAGNTTIVINKLDQDGAEIALSQGAAWLSRGSEASPARFQTFAGAVELGGQSMVRVSNDANKSALEVSVASGSAELRGERAAQLVRPRETLTAGNGQNRISGFDLANGDAFDRWNSEREGKIRGFGREEHVAANTMGSYELAGNGNWVQVDGYWAWRPTTVATGWRPYSDGYWAWQEPWGWVWVDYAPWGYATSHYGRWYFRNAFGWVWYPDPVWAPAWVVWAAFDASIGWAPCDFWGRPIYVYSYNSYYDYGAWCYMDSGYFYGGGGYHYRPGGSARHEPLTASSRHEPARSLASRREIGRDGKFAIHKFDQATMRRVTPVPVRDPVRDLTPAHIQKAAAEGRLRGVGVENRRGDVLSRAATGGGVKPEPWNRREDSGVGGRDAGANDRLKTQGWSGRVPAGGGNSRAAEGWNPRGTANGNDAHVGGNDARGATDRIGGNERVGGNDRFGGTDAARPEGTQRIPDRVDRPSGSEPTSHFRPSGEVRGTETPGGDSGSRPAATYPRDTEPSRSYSPSAPAPSRSRGSESAPTQSRPAPAPARPAPAPARSAPAPAPARSAPAPSRPSDKGKRSSWSSPSLGRAVASRGGSFGGHSASTGHASFGGKSGGFRFGKK